LKIDIPARTVDVTSVLEDQKVSGFLIKATFWLTLMMFFDGYNIQALSYAAPAIVRAWGMSRGALGIIFSLTLVGALLGAVLFGAISDRFGRKPAIATAAVLFGVIAIITGLAATPLQLGVLRFVGGVAIGGLAPAGQALAAELAPSRFRATLVTIVMSGFILGISAGGLVALLIPGFGWQIIFHVGGGASLLVTACFWRYVPESLRFLVVNRRSRAQIVDVLRRMGRADLDRPDADFVVSDEPPPARGWSRVAMLFQGRLLWITPLWCVSCLLGSLETNALMNWMPTLFEQKGLPAHSAVLSLTLFSSAGLLGSLTLMRFVDRFGSIAIAAMPLTAAPLIALLGYDYSVPGSYLTLIAAAGFFLMGGHFCITGVGGLFYPSACRASGYATATVVGRAGGIVGPLLGGELLNGGVALPRIFLVFGLIPLALAAVVLSLGLQHRLLIRARTGV